jgi:hypothetical protein
MIDAFLLAFGTLVAALGAGVALFGGIYVLARIVGLGRCFRCRRAIAPWDAYCHEHGLS